MSAGDSVPDAEDGARGLPQPEEGIVRGEPMRDLPSVMMVFASIGEYRLPALERLGAVLGTQSSLYAGTVAGAIATSIASPRDLGFTELHNHYSRGELLVQTHYPWRAALASDVVVLDLNPRVLNVWLVTIGRCIMRRRTLLWGHAFPRDGASRPTRYLRYLLVGLSAGAICYTEDEAESLRRRTRKPTWAAPNALYPRRSMRFEADTVRRHVLYCGRLEREKKPALLLDAFRVVAERIDEVCLTFVGTGPEEEELRKSAERSGLGHRVSFHGHIPVSDIARLAKVFGGAFVTVIPGFAGLTLTHSTGFGVPVVLAADAPHAPEFSLFREGFNGVSFQSNDVDNLAETIVRVWNDSERWQNRGPAISADCSSQYCLEAMTMGLLRAVNDEGPQ